MCVSLFGQVWNGFYLQTCAFFNLCMQGTHFQPLISQSWSCRLNPITPEGTPGCVNCLLGGGEDGRGYHLAFDQEGEVMVLLTSCFASAQAESLRIHFRLSLSSSYSVTAYIPWPRASGGKTKCSLWYTHMTGFKMETIFKLNLEDQVCSNLQHRELLKTSAAGLCLMGKGEQGWRSKALLTHNEYARESTFPFIPDK